MADNLYPYRSTFLKQQALTAWSHFKKLGYPHSKDESWRFSNINDWLLKYEFLEATNCNREINWINDIYLDLKRISSNNTDLSRAIKRALKLFS